MRYVRPLTIAIGHPDITEFWRSTQQTRRVELESTIQKALGKTGLMSCVQFDHGAIVRKETGRETRALTGDPKMGDPCPPRHKNCRFWVMVYRVGTTVNRADDASYNQK